MTKPTVLRRRMLAEAQNWRCAYCAAAMTDDAAHPIAATVDHVAPRAVGGRDEPLNLVAACRACNGARGADIDAWTFYKLRKRLRDADVWAPGILPPPAVRRFLSAHRELTRAKLALRRLASGGGWTASQLLINELVDTLNDGCTLTALQITHLPRPGSVAGCGRQLGPESKYAAEMEERLPWECLWNRNAIVTSVSDDLDGDVRRQHA